MNGDDGATSGGVRTGRYACANGGLAVKAIVVGGGIGGLAAAVALGHVGVEALVFERADELREIGAGLGLYPNAMKALRKLGLHEAVLEAGRPLRPSGQIRSWRGEVLAEVSTAVMEERFGDVTVGIHRARLQQALLEALEEAGGEVRLGAAFVAFGQGERGVTARFAEGREERGDLLVGADGLRSAVREQLLGDGPPRYAGYSAWRGLVGRAEEYLEGKAGFEVIGCGSRFGLVALGGGAAYWFATKNAPRPEKAEPAEHRAELLSRFGGWHEPIPSVIRATEDADLYFDGLYHREPVARWGRGRVTLLGDAAHPMTPDLGQGAAQAIEDAVVLARSLKEKGEPEAALRLYEDRRLARAAYVVRQSLRAGRIAQMENPLACRMRDAALKILPRRALVGAQLKQMGPVVGYEA